MELFYKSESLKTIYSQLLSALHQNDIVNVLICGDLSLLFKEMEPRLTKEEEAKALLFLGDKHRENFILRRSLLNLFLSLFTKNEVKYDSCRPYVIDGPHFSHSNKPDCLLYTFSQKTLIGCDVETIDPSIDIESIAKNIFFLKSSLSLKDFFYLWTKKEAISKCTQAPFVSCDTKSLFTKTFDLGAKCFSIAALKNIRTIKTYLYAVANS